MNFPRDVFEQQARKEGKSDSYIKSALVYIDRLNSMEIPVIFSLKHLALILDFPYKKISDMANNPNTYYSTFKIRKKRGGFREIQAPQPEMKIIQKWIYQTILKEIRTDSSCMGYSKGSSIRENANVHKNQEVILRVDIYKFFENISFKQIYYVFKSLGYTKYVAIDLAKLTTVKSEGSNVRYLPQGAPTSPALSNLVVRKLDKRLRSLSNKLQVNYTRYADDLIFSGEKGCLPQIGLVTKIIKDEGFKINPNKTAIQKKGNRQIVLGLSVTNGVHISKKYKKEIWTHLKYCKKFGPIKHLENIGESNKAAYKDWLFGKICYVKSIEHEVGKKMMAAFNDISWPL
ncbi:reverse transcriptase domain-containing protein [Bacillus cereus group sp. BY112LC]|uniref:reverse transcriptase domain-containing protein n=1 Tax=Bacillus cereus group sp. BY112LC TaxID=3018086 RepID=UPI0022DFE09C|nr:reverse transcriptase domain-containing protein [Bacillus cereus group sp. BY112LC]MDA1877400.1 reverse transcriptase domain-containing protein [Bacillus cereus group sp. BY112LC]